jgi:hypothetical protein
LSIEVNIRGTGFIDILIAVDNEPQSEDVLARVYKMPGVQVAESIYSPEGPEGPVLIVSIKVDEDKGLLGELLAFALVPA